LTVDAEKKKKAIEITEEVKRRERGDHQ